MKTITSKILMLLVALFLLAMLCSQAYLLFQEHYETETAVAYNAREQVSFKGVYLRDEAVVNCTAKGVIGFTVPDGGKVAKNSVVASVYSSESDIRNQKLIASYEDELQRLKKAQNQGTVQYAQPDFLSSLIVQRNQSIADAARNKDYEKISSEKAELATLMNIMKIVVKEEENYNARIEELEQKIQGLKSSTQEPAEQLSVESCGYFVSYVDGYESELTPDKADSITASQLDGITDKKMTADNSEYLGKIISGYQWKMVGVIDNSGKRYAPGQQAKLKVSAADDYIDVWIEDIRCESDPARSVIVLSSDQLTYPYVQHRCEQVELILNDFEGLKVPRKAIRFLDGEKGVYIQLGQQVAFRKIKVIYEGSDYVLSEKGMPSGYLQMYEDIVIEGIRQLEASTGDTSTEASAEPETTSVSQTEETTINETSQGVVS